jgi:hypothetical protein
MPLAISMRRLLLVLVLLVVFCAGYGATLSVVLHQAALLAQPGDRVVVVFPPGTPVTVALQRLGSAGAVLSSPRGNPWFYQAEVVDAAAVQHLSAQGWLLRVPQEPTLAGCFGMLTEQR